VSDPKRLSEAELEVDLAGMKGDLYEGVVIAMVDEIRRLRRLVCAADDMIGADGWCPGCRRNNVSGGFTHAEGCPAGAIEAEAKATRQT